MEKPDYLKHRQRLRKKFIDSGIESLSDYEKLELLLTYAVSRKDVKPIGKELINKFKSLSSVLDADADNLKKIKGLGEYSTVLIKLVRELSTAYLEENAKEKDYLKSPKTVVDFCRMKLGANHNELFMALFLNTKNKFIDFKIISEGSINTVPIYPRKIIKLALDRHASGIILVHNHPSGDTEPSDVDKDITQSMIKISKDLEIKILDHIIVSRQNYFSFLENNLI
ncbi:MAG: RadC family protein [Thermodesulfobacteriota bacterium]